MRDNNILKAVLLLRKVGNRYTTKEEQVAEVQGWFDKGYMTDRKWKAFLAVVQGITDLATHGTHLECV